MAAGNSNRLNSESKQLLEFEGKTLLLRAVETAIAAGFHSTVVVLGANAETFRKEIVDLPIKIVVNENWKIGMSSSIKRGLAELTTDYLDAALIMLCDQPLLTTKILLDLCDAFVRTKKPIAACQYQNTRGVPALFSNKIFVELLNLQKAEGAKQILKKYEGNIALVDAPEVALDIDTLEDYEKLKQLKFPA